MADDGNHEVTLSGEVMEALAARAEGFGETPDSVLRRVLGVDGGNAAQVPPAPGKRGGRASPGSILPEKAYELPILQELVARGGSGHATEVTDAVGERLADKLTEKDREQLDTGDVRWRNRVQFTRLNLKTQKLIADDSPRGLWEITEAGRAAVEAAGA
jgi:hypothetical protein